MHPWNRIKIAVASFILVLAVSAMAVQPALADDSTPPPAPSTGSVPAAKTGNNLPAKAPAGTDVVVLDRSGNSVPLASQKAAQIVAAGDPIWCPKGVAPRPSVGGCSPAFSGFSSTSPSDYGLSTWLSTNDPSNKLKAGAIWIAAYDPINGGYNSHSVEPGMTNLTLDGSLLTNMSNYSLDINGGWSGTPGSKAIVKTSPSEFDASLSIIDWHAPITISDIVVTGVTYNPNGTYALIVQTDKGGITLNRVQVIDNRDGSFAPGGARLDTSAATLGHLAPVTVNDSVFNHNYGTGLVIESSGAVKIRNLTADYNGIAGAAYGHGADIYNTYSNSNQPVTLAGTNQFKGNAGHGLWIVSDGAVTLNNTTAYGNSYNSSNGYGVHIDNNQDSTPSIVKLTGTNLLTNNAQDGLYIISNGNISLNNITASFNGNNGASIYNDENLLKPQPVTISGTNAFYGNTSSGLEVYSYGAIKLSNITANDNAGGDGAYLDNQGYDANAGGPGITGAAVITRVPVTLTGTNTFNNNYHEGLQVVSVGAISVSNITASNNGTVAKYNGVYLYNTDNWYPNGYFKPYAANVTLSGFGTFENNGFDGIRIYSSGTVKLATLKANYNYENGAYIDTTTTWLAPQSVTLTGVNIFDNNANGNGLKIYNDGKITISNLDASNNGADGAYLDNSTYSWINKFLGVTLTGFNTFRKNPMVGLYITTDGSAVVSHINADENTGDGVNVTVAKNITLVCASSFNNGGTGFSLTSGAAMTLTGFQSYYNRFIDVVHPGGAFHSTSACP